MSKELVTIYFYHLRRDLYFPKVYIWWRYSSPHVNRGFKKVFKNSRFQVVDSGFRIPVLNSGFQAVDSVFQSWILDPKPYLPDSSYWIPASVMELGFRIPCAVFCSKVQDTRFHKQKFPKLWIPKANISRIPKSIFLIWSQYSASKSFFQSQNFASRKKIIVWKVCAAMNWMDKVLVAVCC